MSLEAVVYKNLKHMRAEFGDGPFDVDPDTGQVEPGPGSTVELPDDADCATERWIGNVSGIGDLRGVVGPIFGDRPSIVMDKIVYSGSHFGDQVDVSDMPQLRAELDILRRNDAEIIQEFVENMDALVAVAEQEGNPIVFV